MTDETLPGGRFAAPTRDGNTVTRRIGPSTATGADGIPTVDMIGSRSPLLWYMAYRYQRTHLPRVWACIAEHFQGDQVVHLTSHAQADRYIDRLTRHTGGAP